MISNRSIPAARATRALFLYPGFGIFPFGLIATLVLLTTTVRIGSITFAQHALVVTSAAIIIGFQAIGFWAFAKIAGMRHGLLPYDSVFELLRSLVALDRGLVIGGALLTAGTFGSWRRSVLDKPGLWPDRIH